MWFDVEWFMLCRNLNVVRCDILLSCSGDWDVECITHCDSISHLITSLPPHFTLHHSTSNTISEIPNHSTFGLVRPFLTLSFHITVTSTSCSTLFHFTKPYFKSHHLGQKNKCYWPEWREYHLQYVTKRSPCCVLRLGRLTERGCFLGDARGICGERLFQGFWTNRNGSVVFEKIFVGWWPLNFNRTATSVDFHTVPELWFWW